MSQLMSLGHWPSRLLEKTESAVNSVTLLLTLVVFVFWLFLPVAQMVGAESPWWLLAGPLLLMLLNLAFDLWEQRKEFLQIPIVVTIGRLLTVARDLVALASLARLFTEIARIRQEEELSWGRIWDLLMNMMLGD